MPSMTRDRKLSLDEMEETIQISEAMLLPRVRIFDAEPPRRRTTGVGTADFPAPKHKGSVARWFVMDHQ
jgi:hypothetical protein